MATPNYETVWAAYNGPAWPYTFDDELPKKLVADGIRTEENKYIRGFTSWLEYEIRSISGALRPIDHYYTPYEVRYAPGYRSPDEFDDEDDGDY